MLGSTFYHQTIPNMFLGTLFNDLKVERKKILVGGG